MKRVGDFSSPFFELVSLAEGVFAAIAKPGVGSMGNAGIVHLGDRTLVFDTFVTPEAAQDLRRAAQSLTNTDVTLVVNSHWHGDHVLGNSVFPGATIISTTGTRNRMVEMDTPSDIEQDIAGLTAFIGERQTQIAEMPEGRLRDALEEDLGDRRAMLRNLRDTRIVLPHVTFHDELTVQGSTRMAVIATYGGGHTHSDAFLWLPSEGVLFTGDLCVNQCHAWVGHGNVETWIEIIDRLKSLDFHALVPGHGQVGDKATLRSHRQYLVDLMALANFEQENVSIPVQYEDWNASQMFTRNIESLRKNR